MKKLNTKGFTLIELLAVIVVLAIVMVIAVTSVLNSTRNAAVNSFNSSALSVADFVKQQEQLYALGSGNSESCYDAWREGATPGTAKKITDTYATCFGLNTTDYNLASSEITISDSASTGVASATVKLCAKTTNGAKFANITGSVGGTSIDTSHCLTQSK